MGKLVIVEHRRGLSVLASNVGVGGSNPSGRAIYLIYQDIFDYLDRQFLRKIVRSFSKPTVG